MNYTDNDLFRIAEAAQIRLESGDTITLPDEEIWKDIAGWKGLYQVSNHGNVRCIDTDSRRKFTNEAHLLTPQHTGASASCPQVYLYRMGEKIHRVSIRKLVAEAFMDYPGRSYRLAYIDGNAMNNRLDNLVWKSRKSTAKDDSKRRKMNLVNRRAIFYLASEGVSRALLARAYSVTNGAITHLIERHVNKEKYGKAIVKKDEDER